MQTDPSPKSSSPGSADEPVIRCVGLTKVFKDFWLRPRVTAVDDLHLEVRRRQVFGLLGPNGSGKSTSIKMMLGLLFPTSGSVRVLGEKPSDVATKSRVGYLPEESYLYPFLTGRETLDFFGRLFSLDRATRRRRVDTLLRLVGLEGARNRRVGEYSKGMQRRLGLAQALINNPDLLILDEPTTGLDPLGTRQIKDLILGLKERGKTVLLSSHLLGDVEDVCDRVSILYGGRVQAEGEIGELLADSEHQELETDRLRPETVEKIRELIHKEEGKELRAVRSPRQRLETFFLKIVEEAQARGARTSGASAGGRVDDFLEREYHLPRDVDPVRLLAELSGEPAASDRGDEEEETDDGG